MEILTSRAILRPADPDASLAFYRDALGLAIAREFPGGTVFFVGNGFLEVSARPAGHDDGGAAPGSDGTPGSGGTDGTPGPGGTHAKPGPGGADGTVAADVGGLRLWLQVRDLAATHRELVDAGVPVLRGPRQEPWGLHEMWVADPDGTRIVFVQVPADHPIRRDTRTD